MSTFTITLAEAVTWLAFGRKMTAEELCSWRRDSGGRIPEEANMQLEDAGKQTLEWIAGRRQLKAIRQGKPLIQRIEDAKATVCNIEDAKANFPKIVDLAPTAWIDPFSNTLQSDWMEPDEFGEETSYGYKNPLLDQRQFFKLAASKTLAASGLEADAIDTDTGITPGARAYMPLVEIVENWAAESPSLKESDILEKVLAAYHGGKFARTFVLVDGRVIPADLASFEEEAKLAYLDFFAIERGDFLKWCKDRRETAPAFWADDPVARPEGGDLSGESRYGGQVFVRIDAERKEPRSGRADSDVPNRKPLGRPSLDEQDRPYKSQALQILSEQPDLPVTHAVKRAVESVGVVPVGVDWESRISEKVRKARKASRIK